MDAQRFRTGLDPEPFSTKLYNLRGPHTPHTPAEYTLEMRVDVERHGYCPFEARAAPAM